MADQATVKTNSSAGHRLGAIPSGPGAGPTPANNGNAPCPGDVVTNVAEFGENLLTLAELQARLTVMELKQNVQTAKGTVAVILGGAVLGIAVVALAIAGSTIAIAAIRLRRSVVGFPLTTEEFTRNLNWVRTILLHSGRSVSARRR